MSDVEQHPLQPFLPPGTRLLMLGSFPPSRRRWCMDFFYPNFINDMWRIFGLVFFGDKERFVDREQSVFRRGDIIRFLEAKGIGLYDTACAVRRTKNTASDKDLEVVTPTDLDALLRRIPSCVAVVTTGQKATDVFTSHFAMRPPKVGTSAEFTFDGRLMRLYRMPSSSRAYPMKVERKAEYYEKMFIETGLKD
ncbi:MAG TPA: uracil-DNA glycosylase family protein [Candidatus Prevotella stercoripullorum]|nr:uracil-DNA glycosylase family protein [Candidatus Prevotella stercoripullorum]